MPPISIIQLQPVQCTYQANNDIWSRVWAVRKKVENRLHVAEMRMLRWIMGKTRNDHVRNQIIQEDAKVCQMSTFLRQKRLHWYGHVKRREEDNLSR